MKRYIRKGTMMGVLRRRNLFYRKGRWYLRAKLQQVTIYVADEAIVLPHIHQCWIKETRHKLSIREYAKGCATELLLERRDITAIECVYESGEKQIYKRYNYRENKQESQHLYEV